MELTSRSQRARSTFSSKLGSTTLALAPLCGPGGVISPLCCVPTGRLLRHRAVVDGDGLPARSTSVLDRGGEEDDLEERGGREGMDAAPTTVVEAEARLGELVLEETEMAGCCCC